VSERIARAFVAVVPPAPVLDAVADAVALVGPAPAGWRWTPRQQWHLTLRFLGAVDDAEAVEAALRTALGARPGFDVHLGGAGAFPSSRRAGVLWTGVAGGEAALADLAAVAGAALEPLGYERETSQFHPHLTVARVRGRERRDARPLVAALSGVDLGERFAVGEVVLFESRTRPAGARYAARARFPLAGPDNA
jgi:2'-5' RNA ligase